MKIHSIKTENMAKEILAYILNCGYLDVDYIIGQEESLGLDIFAAVDDANKMESLQMNTVIYNLQLQHVDKIAGKYDIELLEGAHFTTYQNCLDSHVNANEEQIKNDFGDNPGINVEELINEINEW